MKTIFAFLFSCVLIFAENDTLKLKPQNPSPMAENARKHERIEQNEFNGFSAEIEGVFENKFEIYIPQRSEHSSYFDLLIHFHGSSNIVKFAAENYNSGVIAAAVNFKAGSKGYSEKLENPELFSALIDAVIKIVEEKTGRECKIKKIILSGFSAGFGAVRKILSQDKNYEKTDYVLLLDGIHAGYIPERTVLYEGGVIDSSGIAVFIKLAEETSKINSRKKFIITHSEVFPGTFASTTEVVDYIVSRLELKREAILQWGPLGMQNLSRVVKNNFMILGYAGNSAPDHMDHLHALYYFLNLFLEDR